MSAFKKILALAVLLGISFSVCTVYMIFLKPPIKLPTQKVTVWVLPGSSTSRIAEQLKNSGVLTYTWPFKILIRAMRTQKKLKPGEYLFQTSSSPWEVYQALINENVVRYRVTIPEGLTTKETIATISSILSMDPELLYPLLEDEALRKRLKVPNQGFEGFLFPDTYFFTKTTTPLRIIETMVARFFSHIAPEDRFKATTMKWSLLEWTTFASIIEKESGVVSEQPIISSVFHNRLKKGMRLQSDPTVIYGIKNFNGNLTKIDLQTKTPYNTYTNYGIPPGPICNPGQTSLHAALHPEKTDYLYFVATGLGTHVFSKDYETHLKYVAQYQLKNRQPTVVDTSVPATIPTP